MKTKPILIAAVVFVVLASAVLFILYGKNTNKSADEERVKQFLAIFTQYAANGQTDSLINCFEDKNQKNEGVLRLVKLLAGKNGINDEEEPLATVSFNVDNATIETLSDGVVKATIPVLLNRDALEERGSVLILKIAPSENGRLNIIQADARQLFTDFVAYVNFVRSKTLKDEDIYNPKTLAAFAKANQLKTRFDTVIWFAHTQGKTYFYVVNGKWEEYALLQDAPKTYKMGLIGPDLNVIIPVEFDLVGQLGASFQEMIEVQKNNKKGLFDLNGKEVLPVIYDQIFPLDGEGDNIAALRIGDDFFWLKNDFTVTEKSDIRLADILPKLKKTGSFSINSGGYESIIEFNSGEQPGSIYLPPSYMVDLNLLPAYKKFKNPLRKNVVYEDVSDNYVVNRDNIQSDQERNEGDNWLQTLYYSVRDYYLGGREEFYDTRNLVVLDKKRNRVYAVDLSISHEDELTYGVVDGPCNISSIRALNDSLLEVKVGSTFYLTMYDSTKTLTQAPYYHYLTIRNNKLIASTTHRKFSFTKFVKIDDTYFDGCYMVESFNYTNKKTTSKRVYNVTDDMLHYMKNEIYADYGYQFKDKRWIDVFTDANLYKYREGDLVFNKTALDSLTAIDKYNINFIDQKLKTKKTTTLAAK